MHARPSPRRLIQSTIALGLVLSALWVVLRTTPLLGLLFRWGLESTTGTTCVIKDLHWDGWGSLSMRELSVQAPGWPGKTAEIMHVDGIRSQFKPWHLLIGRVSLENLDIESASFRIAQRAGPDGEPVYNLSALTPSSGGFSLKPAFRPEQIHIGTLRFENFLVRGDQVQLRGDRAFTGSLQMVSGGKPGDLAFSLNEVEAADLQTQGSAREVDDGVRLDGQWNDITFDYEVHANRIDFTDSVRPLLPLAIRQTCDKLGLKGTVSDIRLIGSPDQPIAEAQVDLKNLALDLPEVIGRDSWQRFSEGRRGEATGVPRMTVDSGRILLRGDKLSLQNLEGHLQSVDRRGRQPASPTAEPEQIALPLPLQLTMEMDFSKAPIPSSLTDIDAWFADALQHCGLRVKFDVPKYALMRPSPNERWVAELPRIVVNILENFTVRQGTIMIHAEATRAATSAEAAPPELLAKGWLKIEHGEGAYINFRYPLTNVFAQINFDGDQIAVESLTARGSDNCRMEITGKVDGTDDDAGVELNVRTRSPAPIDLPLQNAFDEGPRHIFELLFAREMRDQLVRSGLLAENGTELGGKCEFSIDVKRPRKGGSRVETTGWITVQDARVLCERFPYPITVKRGRIDLEDERIVLPEATWEFRTAAGGEGSIDGDVRIPRLDKGRDAFPNLRLRVVGDQITPSLLAAIPLEGWDSGRAANKRWPGGQFSHAAESMHALGMSGEVGVRGTIGSDAAGHTTLDLNIFLADGRIRPGMHDDGSLEASGLPWPRGFDLDAVKASIHLTEKVAELLSLDATNGGGTVHATGSASLVQRDRALDAKMQHMPFGLWLTQLLPEHVRESATTAWRDAEVTGNFDGTLHLRQRPDREEERLITVKTDGLRFHAGSVPCELRVTRGAFVVDGPSFQLADTRIEGWSAGAPIGVLDACGSVATESSGEKDLNATWRLDRMDSPMIPLVLRAANLPEVAAIADRWNATGEAQGTLTVLEDGTPAQDWTLRVDGGSWLRGDPGGVPIFMQLLPGSRAMLTAGAFSLWSDVTGSDDALVGDVTRGHFGLHGRLGIGPDGPADGGSMALDFEVSPLHETLMGVLPERLADGLRTVELRASDVRAESLELLGWTPVESEVGIRGGIHVDDGAMRAGTNLDHIHALFQVDARGGRPVPVRIDLGGGEAMFEVNRRVVTEVGGSLRIPASGQATQVRDLCGNLYNGRAWASADIGGDTRSWNVQVDVSDAELPGLVRGGDPSQSFANAGTVSASLSLGGMLDGSDSLRGIGHISAIDARMAELPVTLRILQTTQLMLPLWDSLDTAKVDFHVRGSDLRFDRLDLTCPTLRMVGSGSLDLATWNLALRFKNRGTVPLISDLFGAASDQLFVIDVTGPVTEPKVNLTPLPPLGGDPSAEMPAAQTAAKPMETR